MAHSRCPTCKGCGLVPGGFYYCLDPQEAKETGSVNPETCRSCGGTGLIEVVDAPLSLTNSTDPKLDPYSDIATTGSGQWSWTDPRGWR